MKKLAERTPSAPPSLWTRSFGRAAAGVPEPEAGNAQIMVDAGGTHRTGLEHLLDEVRSLHEHLHRVAVALALSEEMLADAFDQIIDADALSAAQSQLQADRARAAAAELRDFATRLAAFRP